MRLDKMIRINLIITGCDIAKLDNKIHIFYSERRASKLLGVCPHVPPSRSFVFYNSRRRVDS